MADVTSFTFYDNPTARTGGTVGTIDWVASTFSIPGVTAFPFVKVDELVNVIGGMASQDLADLEATTVKVLYKDDGTPLITLTAVITPGLPPVLATLQVGVAYSRTKVLDLALALELYIVNALL